MFGRRLALGVGVFLLTSVAALPAETTRSWQNGELLSRKTVPMGRTFVKNRYVYRVRGPHREYLVESQTPLTLDLFVPIKISPDHGQILIQDADGHQYKAHILRRAAVSLRQ
jgi:hypothetical protein